MAEISNHINIDNFVDYKSEYMSLLERCKLTGDKLQAACPFHKGGAESKPSLSVDLVKGTYKCFSCDVKGNFVSFWAEKRGLSNKDAYKEILAKYGKLEHANSQPKKTLLEEYAFRKKLPLELLKNEFGLYDGVHEGEGKFGKYSNPAIKYPYKDENGDLLFERYRLNGKTVRQPAGIPIDAMYGLWRLPSFNLDYVILVEGESDTQTLTHLGFQALGIAGANNVARISRYLRKLGKFRIIIHADRNEAGQKFVNSIASILKKQGHNKEVKSFSTTETDISDYYVKRPNSAREDIKEFVADAKVENILDSVTLPLADMPINVKIPYGYQLDENGIHVMQGRGDKQYYERFCKTPIIITKRIKDIDSAEEKIELAFKVSGKWISDVFERRDIFQSRSVICLASYGCTVSSENAREIVRFLSRMELENEFELASASRCFGWVSRKEFLPFSGKKIILDIEQENQKYVKAFNGSGDMQKWIEVMNGFRSNMIFRFLMTASFAAPLVKLLKNRTFIVYNWANSLSGKSAALKAAMSVWGDPGMLVTNFSATIAFMERYADIMNNLPIAINERQLAKDEEFINSLIYMLSEERGRGRAGRELGTVAPQAEWCTTVVANGEQPLLSSSTMSGINSRVIELYGPPFDDMNSPKTVHSFLKDNYGLVGRKFVELLVKDFKKLKSKFSEWLKDKPVLSVHSDNINFLAFVDYYVSVNIFGESDVFAEAAANRMSTAIEYSLDKANYLDVNEKAVHYIYERFLTNRLMFATKADAGPSGNECWGRLNDNSNVIYFFRSSLGKILKEGGYDYIKTLRYMTENDLLEFNPGKDVRIVKIRGRSANVVAFKVDAYLEKFKIVVAPEDDFKPGEGEFMEV